VTAAARGVATVGRWLVASMVCALVAHTAVYRSLVPDDGLHGYFGWYVPLVAVASLGSLLAVVLAGLCRGSRPARLIRLCLPTRPTTFRGVPVASLASGGLAFLMLQESLERSLDAGALSPATFDASTWPLLVVVLVLAAAVVLAVGRTAVVLTERAFGAGRLRRPRARVQSRLGRGRGVVRKPALLGLHAGLRAPPLVA
jgi:hypothetical protein